MTGTDGGGERLGSTWNVWKRLEARRREATRATSARKHSASGRLRTYCEHHADAWTCPAFDPLSEPLGERRTPCHDDDRQGWPELAASRDFLVLSCSGGRAVRPASAARSRAKSARSSCRLSTCWRAVACSRAAFSHSVCARVSWTAAAVRGLAAMWTLFRVYKATFGRPRRAGSGRWRLRRTAPGRGTASTPDSMCRPRGTGCRAPAAPVAAHAPHPSGAGPASARCSDAGRPARQAGSRRRADETE